MLLIHQLPPRPTNLRVRIWRKLQKLGAVAIKNSVYVLPANEKTYEDFQWLKQEIEGAGGEAAVFRAGSVAGAADDEIIAAFRKVRDEEFAAVAAELDGLCGKIREQTRARHLTAGRLAAHEAELDKLHLELQRVAANDFFNAKGLGTAMAAFARCQRVIRSSQTPGTSSALPSKRGQVLSLAAFQGRRWVTRRNVHIDRIACVWLIKQFIDKRPRFYFVSEGEVLDEAIRFDMPSAEFTHEGEDCTFETMLKRFGLREDQALVELAEIVHDIDLKDDKFHRLEAAGLNAIVNGLSETLRDDRKVIQQTDPIFDALYALISKRRASEDCLGKRKQRRRKKPARRKGSG